MNIEKGIHRLGTVFGVLLGLFLSFWISIFCGIGSFGYFEKEHHDVKVREFWEVIKESSEERVKKESTFDFSLYDDDSRNETENTPVDESTKDLIDRWLQVYLPTTGVVILTSLLSFLTGLYLMKGMAKTINWVIEGFKKEQKASL